MQELQNFGDNAIVTLATSAADNETVGIEGHYHVVCRDANGVLKWEDKVPNLVTAVGKQLLLDTLLKGSAYSVIAAATDTMASNTWTELTNYTVGGSTVRGTPVFASATSTGATPSNVTTSTAASIVYTITGVGGTVYGCFLVTGTGAVSTQSSTAGTLYSEGLFAVAKVTTAGDTVSVSYSSTATS
jgi:hypothetical protein